MSLGVRTHLLSSYMLTHSGKWGPSPYHQTNTLLTPFPSSQLCLSLLLQCQPGGAMYLDRAEDKQEHLWQWDQSLFTAPWACSAHYRPCFMSGMDALCSLLEPYGEC